jgi:hypothetical protein
VKRAWFLKLLGIAPAVPLLPALPPAASEPLTLFFPADIEEVMADVLESEYLPLRYVTQYQTFGLAPRLSKPGVADEIDKLIDPEPR